MTFIENPGNFGQSIGDVNYMYPIEQNVVKGCAYNSRWPQTWGRGRIDRSVYFVRITAVGKFIKEPSTIQYETDPSIFQKTPEEYVTVER